MWREMLWMRRLLTEMLRALVSMDEKWSTVMKVLKRVMVLVLGTRSSDRA